MARPSERSIIAPAPRAREGAPLGQARLGPQVGAHEIVVAARAAIEHGQAGGRGAQRAGDDDAVAGSRAVAPHELLAGRPPSR